MLHRILAILAVLVVMGNALSTHAQNSALADHPLVASNLRLSGGVASGGNGLSRPARIRDWNRLRRRTRLLKGLWLRRCATKRPMTADTLFHIGSQSKTFTAIAILQLQEQGKLRLEDRVEKYIPDSPSKAEQSATPITIFQLLTHTSGLMSEGTKTMHWSDLDFPARDHFDDQIKSVELAFLPAPNANIQTLGSLWRGKSSNMFRGNRSRTTLPRTFSFRFT